MTPDRTISILVPHTDVTALQAMVRPRPSWAPMIFLNSINQKITARVGYCTAGQPAVQRSLHVTCIVVTALPIAVNVQDYFRGTRLRRWRPLLQSVIDSIHPSDCSPSSPLLQQLTSMSGFAQLNLADLKTAWRVSQSPVYRPQSELLHV